MQGYKRLCANMYGVARVSTWSHDLSNRVYIGLYWGYIGDNGKENGNYYSIIGYILGLY